MPEQIDLTAAETPPANPRYSVVRLTLDWETAYIRIDLKGANGERKSHEYTGATATTFMVTLNKVNLSTTSLQKRILQRLVTDGVLAGAISGSPD